MPNRTHLVVEIFSFKKSHPIHKIPSVSPLGKFLKHRGHRKTEKRWKYTSKQNQHNSHVTTCLADKTNHPVDIDPSAGSPTETLLQLLLPLNTTVWSSSSLEYLLLPPRSAPRAAPARFTPRAFCATGATCLLVQLSGPQGPALTGRQSISRKL